MRNNKNTYDVKFAENVLESFKSNVEAIKFIGNLCRCDENAGKEFSIEKNGEQIFVGVSVKQSTGKMMMMTKDKYTARQKIHEDVEARRAERAKYVSEREEVRTARKIAAEKTGALRAEMKVNNARIKEIYAEIHNIHLDARKKKASFLKAFKTVQTKEREAVKALQEELEALLNKNAEHKNNINTPALNIQDAPEMTETVF
jgi:hypothetical protein